MADDKLKTEREGRIPLPNSPELDSSLHQPKWEPMHKANSMRNPDGSLTEVGPDLDPETQKKVTVGNQQYRITGKEFKKAMAFVEKTDNPNWKRTEKKIKDMLSRVSTSVGDNQGLRPSMAKAQFPEKDVKIVTPELKPQLKPEAKVALKDWYRNVYKKGGKSLGYTGFKNKAEYDAYVKDHKNMDKPLSKAFRYTCGNCGHSDAVHTIGGHPQPKSWDCAKCHADTKDIKPITEAPVAREKFKTEPVFSDEEKKKVKETGGYFKMLKAFIEETSRDA